MFQRLGAGINAHPIPASCEDINIRDGKKPNLKHSKIFSLGIPYLAGFKKPNIILFTLLKIFKGLTGKNQPHFLWLSQVFLSLVKGWAPQGRRSSLKRDFLVLEPG